MAHFKLNIQIDTNEAKDQFSFFEDYISHTQTFHKGQKEKLDEIFNSFTDEKEKNDFSDATKTRYLGHAYEFPVIINHTILVSVYSVLENRVKRFEVFLSENIKIKVNPAVNKENNLAAYYANLKNWSGLDFTAVDVLYNDLDIYRKLRNQITHYASSVMKNGVILSDVAAFCEQSEYIDLSRNQFSIFDERLVINYIKKVDNFLEKLMEVLCMIPDSDLI